jgi:hypothetical protein
MAVTEVKCLCGHVNHYNNESPASRFFVCVAPTGTKQFVRTPSQGLVGDYTIWMCPACGTLKGVRLLVK